MPASFSPFKPVQPQTSTSDSSLTPSLCPSVPRPLWCVFSVEDTGCGLTAQQANAIFQPFVQADMSTTRLHGGTGLGLSLCRKLTEMMGGVMGVQSAPGKGSLFWFALPLETAQEPAHTQRTDPLREERLVMCGAPRSLSPTSPCSLSYTSPRPLTTTPPPVCVSSTAAHASLDRRLCSPPHLSVLVVDDHHTNRLVLR